MRPPRKPWPSLVSAGGNLIREEAFESVKAHTNTSLLRKPSNKYTNALFLWQACTQADSSCTQARPDAFLAANFALPVNAFKLFFPKSEPKTDPLCWNLWEQKGVWRQIKVLLSGYRRRFPFKSYRTKIPKRLGPLERSQGPTEPNVQRKQLVLTSVRAEVNKAAVKATRLGGSETAPTIRTGASPEVGFLVLRARKYLEISGETSGSRQECCCCFFQPYFGVETLRLSSEEED